MWCPSLITDYPWHIYSYLLLIPSLNANLIFYFFNAKIFYPLFNPFTQHYYT